VVCGRDPAALLLEVDALDLGGLIGEFRGVVGLRNGLLSLGLRWLCARGLGPGDS
jgi:hypothetical protein